MTYSVIGDTIGFKVMYLLPHPSCLTRTFLDAEGSIGVFGPGVVLQLEGNGVVDERLWALGRTRPTVIEVGTGLQMKVEGKINFIYSEA